MLQGIENTLTESWETDSSIPHPFKQLGFVHMALNQAIGRDQCEPGQDCLLIALQSGSEPLHIAEVALVYLLHPVTEPMSFKLAHDLSKELRKTM